MTQADVRASLGKPFRDSHNEDSDRIHYRLGWQQSFETGLFLDFERAVVVDRKRFSR